MRVTGEQSLGRPVPATTREPGDLLPAVAHASDGVLPQAANGFARATSVLTPLEGDSVMSRLPTCRAFLLATAFSAPGALPLAIPSAYGQTAAPVTPPAQVERITVHGAGRTPQPLAKTGSAITVITRDDLERTATRFIADALRAAPGIAIGRSGPQGGITQARIRGTEANHTLVVIDGILANDPFQSEFDFAGLTAEGVQQVELIRGQHSAIWGSDAVGGVVNILTRRAGAGRTQATLRAEAGSQADRALSLWAGIAGERYDAALTFAAQGSGGFNAARTGDGDEGFTNETYHLTAGVQPLEVLAFCIAARAVNSSGETDPQPFPAGIVRDGDQGTNLKARYGRAAAILTLLDGAWVQEADVQATTTHGQNRTNGIPTFANKGERRRASYRSSFTFAGSIAGPAGAVELAHALTLAADWQEERYRNLALGASTPVNLTRKTENRGLVAEYTLDVGRDLTLGAALRHDDNTRFADASTWRLSASWRIDPATRLRARAGTGIKNPTNFELFGFNPGTFVGNPDLKPETSAGYEFGIDRSLFDDALVIGLTWFAATLEDEIFTASLPGFVSTPRNRTTDSTQDGVEITADARIGAALTLEGALTFLDAEENGIEEVRRPSFSGSLALTWDFAPGGDATLTLRHQGDRVDTTFGAGLPPRITLPAVTTLDVAARYAVSDHVAVFARAENLTDERHEEVFSYVAPGRSFAAGLRIAF